MLFNGFAFAFFFLPLILDLRFLDIDGSPSVLDIVGSPSDTDPTAFAGDLDGKKLPKLILFAICLSDFCFPSGVN